MLIWFIFCVFHCFGKRKPSEGMYTFAGIFGVIEFFCVDILSALEHLG